MRHHSTIAVRILFVSVFALLTFTATAQKNKQFRKAISSPRDHIESSDAKWNVGILGGGNLTTWLHFHSYAASDWYLKNYKIFDGFTNSLGYFGGIGVERMLRKDLSVGLNAIYAKHNIQLAFVDDQFPYQWDPVTQQVVYGQIMKGFKASYSTVEVYLPVTYYIGLASKSSIVPYAYVAPRFSHILPLSSNYMRYAATYTDSENKPLPGYETRYDTVDFNRSTYRMFNVGATLGIGSLFRLNTNNYYFLFKLDISANFNAIPTFKKGEVVNNEFNHLRYSTDAHATLTIMLPLKKQLKGACMDWGEYD